LRKTYEDDAAARARGETVPDRSVTVVQRTETPKPTIKELPDGESNFKDDSLVSAAFSEDHLLDDLPDTSIDMDEFNGFHDPLEGIDLGGFQAVTAEGTAEGGPQWEEIHNLMGVLPGETKVDSPDEDTSIAPTMAEAVAATQDVSPSVYGLPMDEAHVQAIAAGAEGGLVVPMLGATDGLEASGIPTEEINEMPQTTVYTDTSTEGLIDPEAISEGFAGRATASTAGEVGETAVHRPSAAEV
jgi:hypothetical protein